MANLVYVSLFLLSTLLLASGAAPPPLTGYIVGAHWACPGGSTCHDWQLDVTRLLPQSVAKDGIFPLVTLLNGVANKDTTFQILDAFNNNTREFFVAATIKPRVVTLWSVHINNDVTAAQIVANTTFEFPADANSLLRIQPTLNNTVLALFNDGSVHAVNASTGAISLLGHVFAQHTTGIATQGSAVDLANNALYALLFDSAHDHPWIITMDLNSGNIVASYNITIPALPHYLENWVGEYAFNALWAPSEQAMYVFMQGDVFSQDQVWSIEPANGHAYPAVGSFTLDNLQFDSISPKDNDALQVDCYDPINQLLYVQARHLIYMMALSFMH